MSNWTPTTEQIKDATSLEGATAIEGNEFDRWLARRDAEVAAQALREAASNPRARLVGHSGVSVRWLRSMADALTPPATDALSVDR